jgi:hypothetical protein
VEGKNGPIVRRHIGYGHIGSQHAEAVHKFYAAHLNPYLNFHRPCGFATVSLDARGKRQRQYKEGRLCHPLQEVEGIAGSGEIFEAARELCATGPTGAEDERHRMRTEDGGGKVHLLRRCKIEWPLVPRTP